MRILFAMSLVAVVLFCGCGKKGPPVPKFYRPLEQEDRDGRQKLKGQDIADESGRQLFEMYGEEQTIEEQRPEGPVGPPEELDEVPEEFKYLYDSPREDEKEDESEQQQDDDSDE